MNEDIDKFFNTTNKVTLSHTEKESIHSTLLTQMEIYPIKYKKAVLFETFFFKHTFATALVVVLFLGGATTSLAEKAFPGDLLYGVKTKVNEQILGLFAQGNLSKAEWHIELAERRLRDVEYLSKETSVSPEIKQEVREKLEEVTKQAEESTKNLTIEVEAGVEVANEDKNSKVDEESLTIEAATLSTLRIDAEPSAMAITKEEIEARLEEIVKKTPSLRRAIRSSTLISPTTLVHLRKELLLTEKAVFETTESLEAGAQNEAEAFLKKAEEGVLNIEGSLLLILEISSKKTDKKFSNKDNMVGNVLDGVESEDTEKESVPNKNLLE